MWSECKFLKWLFCEHNFSDDGIFFSTQCQGQKMWVVLFCLCSVNHGKVYRGKQWLFLSSFKHYSVFLWLYPAVKPILCGWGHLSSLISRTVCESQQMLASLDLANTPSLELVLTFCLPVWILYLNLCWPILSVHICWHLKNMSFVCWLLF